MSFISVQAQVELRDLAHEHTWRGDDGTVCSSIDLGRISLVFESAADARAVAERCAKAADAIEALTTEGEATS